MKEDTFTPFGSFKPPQEERIPILIDNFLQNVHTKNPVLDVEALVRQGLVAAEQGLGWDAWSCLVLIACALGHISKPFSVAEGEADIRGLERAESIQIFGKDLEGADSYFLLASRRLGTLKPTMLGAQCYFFAGGKKTLEHISMRLQLRSIVYMMYTLRPLSSWQYFYYASNLLQMHLKISHGTHAGSGLLDIPHADLISMGRQERRSEQSLYWSCFKSECEFRVELPLPQSEISSFQHPNPFPSPPSPGSPLLKAREEFSNSPLHASSTRHDSFTTTTSSQYNECGLLLKQHSKHLCHEQESWYYYLTETALRRIGNRIINTFFRQDRKSWLNVKPLLRMAQEFDVQVSSWSANLPSVMKHYEATSTIKAPMLNAEIETAGSSVSRELSWATENRILEMRSWLYQPFLYYLIHCNMVLSPVSLSHGRRDSDTGPTIQSLLSPSVDACVSPHGIQADDLDEEERSILYRLIATGIECNLKTLDVRCLRHRHHGLWYDLRSLMCAALVILAIVKSGNGHWIPGGPKTLWGTTRDSITVGGRIGRALRQLEFWSEEAPELKRHYDVLLEITQVVRQQFEEVS